MLGGFSRWSDVSALMPGWSMSWGPACMMMQGPVNPRTSMQQISPTMWRGKKSSASMDKSETPRLRLARHAASVGPGQAYAMHGSAAAEITPPCCLSLYPIIACATIGLGLLKRHLAAPSLVSPLHQVCYDRHAPARTTRMPRPPPCAHRMLVFDQARQFQLTPCWLVR